MALVADPETGRLSEVAAGAAAGAAAEGGAVAGVEVGGSVQTVGDYRVEGGQGRLLYTLAAVQLLLALFVPPLLAGYLRRRRS